MMLLSIQSRCKDNVLLTIVKMNSLYSILTNSNKTDTTFVTHCSKNSSIHLYNLGELIQKYNVINWNMNRPPDEMRVTAIAEYFAGYDNQCIPGIISTWLQGNTLHVYDGIHRFVAALQQEMHHVNIIVSILSTDDEQLVIEDFRRLNSSNPIPMLYLQDNQEQKLMVCQLVADELVKNYPGFVSPSRRPHKHNFNRDGVIDMLSSIDFDGTVIDIEKKLYNSFITLNSMAAKYVTEHKIKCPSKCHYCKFYLFYLPDYLITSHIEEAVK